MKDPGNDDADARPGTEADATANEPEAPSPLEAFESTFDTGEESAALRLANDVAAAITQLEWRARWWLELGLAMERRSRFELAARFYGNGSTLEPTDEDVAYFLFNNRGFSLNQLGHHEAAEKDCRRAAEIHPLRHNAWKNLGVALEGQRLYPEAARAYLTAARANFADGRALVCSSTCCASTRTWCAPWTRASTTSWRS